MLRVLYELFQVESLSSTKDHQEGADTNTPLVMLREVTVTPHTHAHADTRAHTHTHTDTIQRQVQVKEHTQEEGGFN